MVTERLDSARRYAFNSASQLYSIRRAVLKKIKLRNNTTTNLVVHLKTEPLFFISTMVCRFRLRVQTRGVRMSNSRTLTAVCVFIVSVHTHDYWPAGLPGSCA